MFLCLFCPNSHSCWLSSAYPTLFGLRGFLGFGLWFFVVCLSWFCCLEVEICIWGTLWSIFLVSLTKKQPKKTGFGYRGPLKGRGVLAQSEWLFSAEQGANTWLSTAARHWEDWECCDSILYTGIRFLVLMRQPLEAFGEVTDPLSVPERQRVPEAHAQGRKQVPLCWSRLLLLQTL